MKFLPAKPGADIKGRFGTAIRHARKRLGLTQEELAVRAGLHRTYIADVERGARNVSLDTIERLACGLEISISALLEGVDSEAALFTRVEVDQVMRLATEQLHGQGNVHFRALQEALQAYESSKNSAEKHESWRKVERQARNVQQWNVNSNVTPQRTGAS